MDPDNFQSSIFYPVSKQDKAGTDYEDNRLDSILSTMKLVLKKREKIMKTLVHAEEILLEYFMRSIVKFLGKKPHN